MKVQKHINVREHENSNWNWITVDGDVITHWSDNMKDFRLSVSVNVKSKLVENSLSLRLFK